MKQHATPIAQRNWNWAWACGGVLVVVVWKVILLAVARLGEPVGLAVLAELREFKQEPAPNVANDRLVFAQDTAEGIGVYYCDLASMQPQLLGEQKERGSLGRRLGMLGWSPGDKWFACAFPDDQRNEQWIHIFDGQSGKLLSRLGGELGLKQLVWLSNEAFAYSTETGIRTVLQQGDGTWAHRRNYQSLAKKLEDLTALSADVLAWRDGPKVSVLDVRVGGAREVWCATTNELVQITRGRGEQELLVNCRDASGQWLFRLQLDGRISERERVYEASDFVRDVRAMGRGISYAFLANDPGGCAFAVKLPESAGLKLIPWNGGARRLVLNGSKLFFYGYEEGSVPGVWECDTVSGEFKRVVAGGSSAKVGVVRTMSGLMTNRSGQVRFYRLLHSPKARDEKKPVLLAQEMNEWFAGFQIAARCGYLVAVVDRPFEHTWAGDLPHTWAEDVGALYDIVAKHPNADTNHVYLYACSRDTSGMSQLVSEQPALAKGLICYSPSALPDPARLQGKNLLLTSGDSAGDSERLRNFQDRAVQSGNAVTLLLQPGSGHMPGSGNIETERATELSRFLQRQE
ncbi:MAG TPA: hypothetical protein VFZ59_24990 [Verrucomicrobiae bacterium]|nr:hypothetical protein [Verrucomicrobiae bacterium]